MARRQRSRHFAPPSTAEPIPFGPPVSRREWIAVAVLVLLAAALRFAFPDRMAIEHFDEGVYASNIFFGPDEGNRYPYRHLYAPPLLPWLIEWCIVFLGPEGIAPFLPALVLGTATAPLAWWAARCWFGPASGLAAGLLVATSDFHVLYSRTALTDVPVAFFILLAVYLYWEAVRRGSLGWSLAAGIATGLAWWTKYTGWLPLAIAAAGSVAWVIFERRAAGASPRVRLFAVAKCFAATAITAFVVWSPVLWGLQEYGGYAAVAENHRGYLQPLSEWGHNLVQQAAHLAAQSGAPTTLSLALGASVLPLASRWPFSVRLALSIWCAVTTAWAVFALGPAFTLALLTVVGLAIELVGSIRPDAASDGARVAPARLLAAWLLTAWFIGMFVTPPLYHPYPRLAMPWVMASLLGVTVWATRTTAHAAARGFNRRDLFPVALLALPMAMIVEGFPSGGDLTAGATVPGWEDRNGLQKAAHVAVEAVERDHSPDEPAVVYVYETLSGPATFFHIATELSAEQTAVLPAGNLSVLAGPASPVPIYVVTSFRDFDAWAETVSREEWRSIGNQVTTVVDQAFTFPSTLLELDANDPYLGNWTALQVFLVEPE